MTKRDKIEALIASRIRRLEEIAKWTPEQAKQFLASKQPIQGSKQLCRVNQ